MSKQHLPLKSDQVQSFQAAYLEQGSGLPILFLHGFLGESSCWLPMMKQLSNYRCIALDLLGFGESSKPELRYTIWHQVEFLQEFVNALELQQFWLVGHSYGGWTAAAYVIACKTGHIGLPEDQRDFPLPYDALAGLALIAPAGIRDDQFVGRYNHLRPLLWETPWIDWGLKAIAPISRLIGQQSALTQICEVRQALLAQPVAKSFLRDRLRPEDAIDTVETELHHITIPTLVIAAQQDETIPLWHCQTYADGIQNAQLTTFPDADHGLLQTHPQAIAHELFEAIAQTRMTPPNI